MKKKNSLKKLPFVGHQSTFLLDFSVDDDLEDLKDPE